MGQMEKELGLVLRCVWGKTLRALCSQCKAVVIETVGSGEVDTPINGGKERG